MTREISGLAEIAGEFEAVIVDQYGVLHDGEAPFEGAQAALLALKQRGVPVAALTNSGKRAKTNLDRLARLGFAAELFHQVVSSGELARDTIAGLPAGAALLLIARDGETELADGLDVRLSKPGEPAEMVVIASVEPFQVSREDYASRLRPYAQSKTPALLVNPDLLLTQAGQTAFGPGAVAEDYRRMGGPVEVLGKPASAMFETALRAMGSPAPEKVLMIGDSPHHDISGAAALGLKTLLIRSGVQSRLEGAAPDYAMTRLSW